MILLHFCFDVSDYISLRICKRVLAAFIFIQGIFRSCSQALHIKTWQRRLHHLRGLSLQDFSDLFQSSNTVYVMLMPLTKKRGWLVKMHDFVSFACYSVEISAMPSLCYTTFILMEIYLMQSSFRSTVSPIFHKPELLSILLYIPGSHS